MSVRILHFSDVHLPFPPGAFRTSEILHPKRMIALLNFKFRRKTKYKHALQKLNGLNQLLRHEPVDYIFYTGDSLNLGLEREYTVGAPRILETLALAQRGSLAVPGNHDLYSGSSPALYRKHFAACLHSDLPEAATLTGYPLVRWIGDDAVAIAFNSARPNFSFWNSSGRVPNLELDALQNLLARPEIAMRKHIFMLTHYPFDTADFFHGLRNSRALLRVLRPHQNLVLLHGHNHRPYTYFLPDTTIPLYCAGSLSKAGSESFWSFELVGDTLNARRGVWKNARFIVV